MSVPTATWLDALFGKGLPINRKERYYTGTVLPMIVASDGFKHFGKFLALCGVQENVAVQANPDAGNVQFFTEYGFEESLKDEADKLRFGKTGGRHAPDLVVYVEGERSLLLCVEAKVFSRPSKADLQVQLREQKELLQVMQQGIQTAPSICQVALLPRGLNMPGPIDEVPVLTWESVADAFREVASPYWIRVLDLALHDYDRLASPSSGARANSDEFIAGEGILDLHLKERPYTWMGRRGGLEGSELREDVETGKWKTQRYEVRREPLIGNPNWFPIADFIKKIVDFAERR